MFESLKESWRKAGEEVDAERALKKQKKLEQQQAEYEQQLATLVFQGTLSTSNEYGHFSGSLNMESLYQFFMHKLDTNNPIIAKLTEENNFLRKQISQQQQCIDEQHAVIENLLQQQRQR